MIYGIGTDVLDAQRMRRLFERYGARLPERLLHEAEWEGFRGARDPAHYLARCFAIKEAVAKALGTGVRGFAYQDIGSMRDALGKPHLVFGGALPQRLRAQGITRSHVSLSDEGEMILAFVILEKGAP